ncbi:MAG: type IV secretion system DNA-binding domain-containing protein [Clostridia bacterium]
MVFKKEGLFQNILITGSIGSGKTSSAISNLLYQLLSSSMCGLIIDIKGTYKNILKQMIEKLNLDIKVKEISLDNEFVYNPIDRNDLSSSEIASRLKKVLELVSRNNNSDSYWLDKAKGYISDFITIIRVTNKYVDFLKLHEIIINEKILKETLLSVKNKVLNNKFSDEDLFKINNALGNLKNEFLNLDERTKNIIKSEITRITSPFVSDYNLYNKFCGKSENIDFSTELVILSIDIGKNEEIAKIIATYIKLEFQKFVLSQEGPKKEMFFVCDEYQSVANENDADFFSISREFKCINIISMQSYSSLNNTLVNQNAAKTIIQNLVNKIWFRNDDVYTVREIINQIGKETHKVKSIGYSENSYNSKYNALNKNFKDIKSGLTQSYSINEKVEYKFNEEYLTLQLKAFEAVILCSDGKSMKLFSKVKLKRWDENERSIKK